MLMERMLKPSLLIKLLLLNLFLLSATVTVWAVPHIKVLKLAVTNPSDELRAHENITVQVAELKRNAIDLYGKRRPGLYLELFGAPEYDYHEESPFGRDIYKIGDAIGIGSVAAIVDGKVVKVEDVQERSWRIVADGPVRSIVELKYKRWKVGGLKANH